MDLPSEIHKRDGVQDSGSEIQMFNVISIPSSFFIYTCNKIWKICFNFPLESLINFSKYLKFFNWCINIPSTKTKDIFKPIENLFSIIYRYNIFKKNFLINKTSLSKLLTDKVLIIVSDLILAMNSFFFTNEWVKLIDSSATDCN